MLVTPNALIEFLSGTWEDEAVFMASKGSCGGWIQSARRYVIPNNPNTAPQQAIRLAFKQVAAFWKSAADKTIGAAIFTRATMNADVLGIAQNLQYRGIPLAGADAARQTFVMLAMLQCMDAADWTMWAVLPQNCTTEPQLEDILNNIAAGESLIANRYQRDRVGYIG
jgi:hypothetical protein